MASVYPVMNLRTIALSVATATCLLTVTACGDDTTDSAAQATSEATTAPTSAPTTEASAADGDHGGHDHSEDSDASGYPVTIDNCGVSLTFEQAPQRVVILNGTSVAEVETFLALGIEDSIVANAQSYGSSDIDGMLEAIAALPTGGVELNENFEVPREQTLAMEPDLVVSTWAGGFSEEMGSVTRDQLTELGINSYVTPVNCSYGALDPRPEDVEAWDNQTYEASFQLLEELGTIFGVEDRAAEVIGDARARIEAVAAEPGEDPPAVLIAYPGMSMMNANGLPAVFGGSFYDSIIDATGGVNSFPGRDFAEMGSVNAEELAAADVDVLVVGLFMPGEDPAAYADALFAQYPQWSAAETGTWISLSESVYLGPHNAVAVEAIADAIATLG